MQEDLHPADRPIVRRMSVRQKTQQMTGEHATGEQTTGEGTRPTPDPGYARFLPDYLFGWEASGSFLPNSFKIASIFVYFSSAGIPGCSPA